MSKEATITAQTWTTRRLLTWVTGFLDRHGIESARVVAEMLLAHVLGCERMRLYMDVDRPAGGDELDRLRSLVARAARSEPVHYLIGEAAFYWRSFAVGPCTLIPQPCTETLVDRVIAELRGEPRSDGEAAELLLADVGTGSGCIAITLAAQLPGARVLATDVVEDALELAGRNAERHGVASRIDFAAGSLSDPLRERVDRDGRRFDAICANLPYVPHFEADLMDPSVREHVPSSAWDGGEDGLKLVGPFIADAVGLLRPGGLLAVEIADVHRDRVLSISREAGLVNVEVLTDQDGLWRVTVGKRSDGATERRSDEVPDPQSLIQRVPRRPS